MSDELEEKRLKDLALRLAAAYGSWFAGYAGVDYTLTRFRNEESEPAEYWIKIALEMKEALR